MAWQDDETWTPEDLRAWREAMGWTQAQAAEALGVTRHSVQNWEAGRAPISKTVVLAAKRLSKEARMRGEHGPVQLIWHDGHLRPDLNEPRGRVARLHIEAFPSVDEALAQMMTYVTQGGQRFGFMIVNADGEPIWNLPELQREWRRRQGMLEQTTAPTSHKLYTLYWEGPRDQQVMMFEVSADDETDARMLVHEHSARPGTPGLIVILSAPTKTKEPKGVLKNELISWDHYVALRDKWRSYSGPH